MDVLKLSHLSKSFGGLAVIRDVSFSVPERCVFGLIGKNGAGKTTTMKMILGFLRPDGGETKVCGQRVVYGGAATNRHIGYLPDVPEFYGYMRPREYLKFCGQLSGMRAARIREKSDELLSMVGLADANRKIGGFSRGMKQRLGIAQALLNEPKLLICDEPTSALDPVGRKEILDILSLAAKQTAILFSTHILSDVERVCDRIGILDEGKIALTGDLDEIKSTYRQDTIRLELDGQNGAQWLANTLKQLSFVSQTSVKENNVTLRISDARSHWCDVLEAILREGIPLLRYEQLEPSLEDVFLEVVSSKNKSF